MKKNNSTQLPTAEEFANSDIENTRLDLKEAVIDVLENETGPVYCVKFRIRERIETKTGNSVLWSMLNNAGWDPVLITDEPTTELAECKGYITAYWVVHFKARSEESK